MQFNKRNQVFRVSLVYARCNAPERSELWDDLENFHPLGCPWMVGGDFNVILNEEEKLGGLDFTQQEAIDFSQCMSVCAEVNFTGSKYTWPSGRTNEVCIFKRLDRVLVNMEFNVVFPTVKVHHLIHRGSNHAPLDVICNSEVRFLNKPFCFLTFWCNHKNFNEIVKRNWRVDFKGCPFLELYAKMKRVKKAQDFVISLYMLRSGSISFEI